MLSLDYYFHTTYHNIKPVGNSKIQCNDKKYCTEILFILVITKVDNVLIILEELLCLKLCMVHIF